MDKSIYLPHLATIISRKVGVREFSLNAVEHDMEIDAATHEGVVKTLSSLGEE